MVLAADCASLFIVIHTILTASYIIMCILHDIFVITDLVWNQCDSPYSTSMNVGC